MIGSLALLLAAAPAAAAKPASVAAPASAPAPSMTEEIFISSGADPEDPAKGAPPIRAVWNFGRAHDWIPLSEFPSAMLPAGEGDTRVSLRLTVAADNSIQQCTALDISHFDRATKAWVDGDPRLGPFGCGLMHKYARFRHAIDSTGKPIAAEIVRTIYFRRGAAPTPAVPMPLPPSGWVGTRQYDPKAWPSSFWIARTPLAAPQGKQFLAKAKDLPRTAAAGVSLSIAADGTPGECTVGRSSGDPRIDTASCAALASIRFRPSYYRTTGTPFLIRWSGRDAELVLPRTRAILPELAAPVVLADADRPGGTLPEQPSVRLAVSLDAQGKPLRCEISSSNLDDAGDAASCAIAMTRPRYTVPRNVFEEPSPGGINLRLDWRALSLQPDGY